MTNNVQFPGELVVPDISDYYLRLPRQTDASSLEQLDAEAALGPYLDWRQLDSNPSAFLDRMVQMADEGSHWPYFIIDSRGGDQPIMGSVSLFSSGGGEPAEWYLGYWLLPEHRGKSIARRSSQTVIDQAKIQGVERVWLEIAEDNFDSQMVALKLGATATAETYECYLQGHAFSIRKWGVDL